MGHQDDCSLHSDALGRDCDRHETLHESLPETLLYSIFYMHVFQTQCRYSNLIANPNAFFCFPSLQIHLVSWAGTNPFSELPEHERHCTHR